ncbi:MAG: hypothetical protein JWR20_766 [Marmoricola sp.]|nr:hypothetical protein [Marmoricola sp.]
MTLRRSLADPVATWRTGTRQSQLATLAALLAGVAGCFAVSVHRYDLMPLTSYYLWLLLGMLLLRYQPLLVLVALTTLAAVTAMLLDPPMTLVRGSALVTLAVSVVLILFASSRQQSGLPGPVSEAMLTDLKRRLQSQGTIPALPPGWRSQSAMIAASGVGYGGDFLVARLSDDERRLELILVDVCGKGVGAASRALQFGGALGGLIGALPPHGLFQAANDFLLRQHDDEVFATAVHVTLDLTTGAYGLTSAGHPPALLWSAARSTWEVDGARGTALGILADPELHHTSGVLAPGDALLFCTDGVVESRHQDLDTGVRWLREVGAQAVGTGFAGAARRIVAQVDRGDDDRAVLILDRSA